MEKNKKSNVFKVSIIVPVWNVEKYIAKCLDSLVNQTLEEIEIIVVNDGSPDNSQKIIDKYVKKYPDKSKNLFIKENGGQGSARNMGIEKAKGEYISFVDSDDWLDSEALEKNV
ncbi:MAG: glycosyltransferase family 2 protein [Bacilli bacterium]|nr:MAG: glycosyltransferase family 2 protein [Bacilli bacterium]